MNVHSVSKLLLGNNVLTILLCKALLMHFLVSVLGLFQMVLSSKKLQLINMIYRQETVLLQIHFCHFKLK